MGIILGCIGDDFTGSTDLANTLVRNRLSCVLFTGLPDYETFLEVLESAGTEAYSAVIALKTRTADPGYAVSQSLAALKLLQKGGAQQFLFKYCSTFDSTDRGNIGPVAKALLEALDSDFTIACPAFPENSRSIYMGHLFVGDKLLQNSSMKDHPLTPMKESDLVELLSRQVNEKTGLIKYETVEKGAEAVKEEIERFRKEKIRFAVADALNTSHLLTLGEAASGLRLITGGSGIAMGLPQNYRMRGILSDNGSAEMRDQFKKIKAGRKAVLSGSCSSATQKQIEFMKERYPSIKLDILSMLPDIEGYVSKALEPVYPLLEKGPVLVYTSDNPDAVKAAQDKLGIEKAGESAEKAISIAAVKLKQHGVNRFVIAGGETSGAVVSALKIKGLVTGPQIDPGVPWTVSPGKDLLALALKSGNFGSTDFFEKAFIMLDKLTDNKAQETI